MSTRVLDEHTPDYWLAWYKENVSEARLKTKNSALLRMYGIGLVDYYIVLALQGGMCALCPNKPTPERPFLNVDHDHKSRLFRGLLCQFCNHYIVGRHTDWKRLQAAADYLRWTPASRAGISVTAPVRKKKRKGSKKRG